MELRADDEAEDEIVIRGIEYELLLEGSAWPHIVSPHISDQFIENELLFAEGEYLDEGLLAETERNLLATGQFASVRIELDSVSRFASKVVIILEPQPRILPQLHLATGGDEESFGLGLTLRDASSGGTRLGALASDRSENDIGANLNLDLALHRFLGTPLSIAGQLDWNDARRDINALAAKPLYSSYDGFAYGLKVEVSDGFEFVYPLPDSVQRVDQSRLRGAAWFSSALRKDDRFIITALLLLDDVESDRAELRRALDNSGRFLLGFSSLAQEFGSAVTLDETASGRVPIGAWGTAVLGRAFPLASAGEKLFYAGGQVQLSALLGEAYLFGSLAAGSGFQDSEARYTHLSFRGLGHFRLSSSLLLAARLRQQTSWNWDAFRDLLLDSDAGLRGYTANALRGDNRIIASVEARLRPGWRLAGFDLAMALFYDAGAIWDQERQLADIRVHKALGAGLRLHHGFFGGNNVFRVDAAYNFDRSEIGQIVLSTSHPFPLFGSHDFEVPQFFGEQIDRE